MRLKEEVISACNSETLLEHFEGHVPTGLAKNLMEYKPLEKHQSKTWMKTKWEALHITPINLTDIERKLNHKQITRHLHLAHASLHTDLSTSKPWTIPSRYQTIPEQIRVKRQKCVSVHWFKRFLKLKEYNHRPIDQKRQKWHTHHTTKTIFCHIRKIISFSGKP